MTIADTPTQARDNNQLTRFKGLSDSEVLASRQQHGDNVLTPPEREPWWKLFLEKFDDPVIRILMIAAFVALGVGVFHGEFLEPVGILLAILLATTLAFINEFKAAREFDILNKVNDDVPIKVIRGGAYLTVPRKDLVVGDIVLLEAGEAVPADGKVLEAVSLQVDEASLTGESLPVTKTTSEALDSKAAKERTFPADRMFRGTTLMDGHGVYCVTSVGNHTEIGKVIVQSEEETDEVTPLNAQLERLSKVIGVVGFGIAALTFAALFARGLIGGELILSRPQAYFVTLLLVSVLVAGVKIWLPIVYDAFELLKKPKEPPAWLEAEGFGGWMKTVGLGLILFGAGAGILWSAGLIAQSPREWLSTNVGTALLQYFMIAVTIIVVAVPEGLAMSVTLSLAYSMRKMTASNNLVRRMHACETIGAATVICSDKTGTLTMNEMRVQGVNVPGLNSDENIKDLKSQAAKLLVEAIAANSTAHLSRKQGETTRGLGNPTESALLLWLDENDIDYILHRDAFRSSHQLTFSTERKFMRTYGTSAATGTRVLHVKGAPEVVLSRCSRVLTSQGPAELTEHQSQIEKELRECQSRGMRTLGFAYYDVPEGTEIDVHADHVSREKVWLGFVAIADPVRADVPDAVKACRDAGIEVKIVTGDNSDTAREIGRQIGLIEEAATSNQVTGNTFSGMDDDQAKKMVQDIRVMSRARPADKMRLVKLLQENGHVVAVTGDGTNDAPALNYANVGLSMGRTGTSVAKEASDIVLLDDSFRSIVNAVIWGRSLYQNIQRFILFQLTINVAALLIALLGPFIGVQVPLTVIQMLWINLIMDTFAALALATEPPDPAVMKRQPRKATDFIVTPAMAKGIFGVAGAFLVLLVGLLLYIQRDGTVTPYELTVFYTTFVLLQFWNLFNARRLSSARSALTGLGSNPLFGLIAVSILLGQIVITQWGGRVFKTVPLSLKDWVLIVAATSLVLWAGELWRFIQRQRGTPAVESAGQS